MSRHESAATLHHIGGEMFAWSDHDPTRGPKVARSGAVEELLSRLAVRGGTALVAGPHDPGVIAGLLNRGLGITCLVRALADADRLRQDFPAITVLCGSIAKLETEARFDLVVALDGFDRLGSTEGEQISHADALQTLTSTVAEGGALVLMTDNPLGVHHIVELSPAQHYEWDAAWSPVSEYEDLRPASLAQVERALLAKGLNLGAAYAVYPSPQTPAVLVERRLLGDTTSLLRANVAALLSQSLTDAYRDTPVLRDPRPLVARALRAGIEESIAPGWLTVARRGAPKETDGRHALLAGGPDDLSAFALSVVDGAPSVEVLRTPAGRVERAGMRWVTDLSGYATMGGRIFEERLLQLCAQADVVGLRAEFNRFVSWLETQATNGSIAGPAAFSTMHTVLDLGYDLRPVPPRWVPVDRVPVATVLARAMWSFGVRLITGHHPHPFQLTSSAQELTSELLTMVGRKLGKHDLQAAVNLQVAYETADRQLNHTQQRNRRAELLAIQPGTVTIDISGYRELLNANWRQRYQVDHLLADKEWIDQTIKSRDLALSRMDWELQLLRNNFTGKLLMISRAAYHLLRRDLGKVIRRLLPKGSARQEMQ